jgi:Ca-activated chloride channel family protein
MASEHDILARLPEAPAPAPKIRQAAIANALERFEKKSRTISQGSAHDLRLMQHTAASTQPSRRRSVMRARNVIAASVAVLIAGSAIGLYVHKTPGQFEIAYNDKQARISPPIVQDRLEETKAPQPAPPRDAFEKSDVSPRQAPGTPAPKGAGEYALRGQSDSRIAQAPVSRDEHRRGRVDGYIATPEPTPPAEPSGRDRFTSTAENAFKTVREAPVSTFSIDVDTASYSFVRASLNRNALPQPAAVRTEEFINYFPYAYPAPATASEPFRTTVAVFPSPWSDGRKIVQIGIKGYAVQAATRPRANLVFLIDTSGSMNAPNRLPLVKQSLAMLLTQLEANDRVAIVTYAGHAGTALEPTAASDKAKILGVIERLDAGGSTAGAEGIRQAYALAEQNFDPNGVNRVILATDGDFNVGITNRDELKGFIERQRGKGIFLSILGFGMGNYNDALMQALAQNGNGAAAYIDTLNEARKVLVDEATSTLFPIAKDVKIQVEFNPATVAEYRLIGYDTRLLNRDDFANDKADAGDVGSGQTVTALYEIVPVGGARVIGDLRYGEPAGAAGPASATGEYAFVNIRYKLPKSDVSTLISTPVDRSSESARFAEAPVDARFATSVAAFGEMLRGGRHVGALTYDDVLRIAATARGDDPFGYRTEFLQLVRAAKTASAMQPLRP